MTALFITSLEEGSGKTTIGAGLARRISRDNKKVGFFKPIISDAKNIKAGTDTDAAFFKQFLSLAEPLEVISPVLSNGKDLASKVKDAYGKIAQGKDVVIVEGPSEQFASARSIAEALGAKVIVVESYSNEPLKSVAKYQEIKTFGVVLTKVPKSQAAKAKTDATAVAGDKKISVLGLLPEDRGLLTLTVGDLAARVNGEIVRGAEKSAELLNNFMLGAFTQDSGVDYFIRKDNKAVVLRSERPDMQLAALETPTRCLVLSGSQPLKPIVLERAALKSVPIILTKTDVTTIAATIEEALSQGKFNQESKLPRLAELLEPVLDFKTVYKELGLG